MTEEETSRIFDILQLNYPNSIKGKTDAETLARIKLWTTIFASDSYADVQAACLSFMAKDTTRFMPPVGAIKQELIGLRCADSELTSAQAWSMVSMAIRNSGYHAEEEFAKLPKTVQQAVGCPSQLHTWAIDEDFNEGVVQSHFMRSYAERAKYEREMMSLPNATRKILGIMLREEGADETKSIGISRMQSL